MHLSDSKRENVFFTVVFLVYYIISASVVPYLGVRMEFLSFGNAVTQSTVQPDLLFALVLCTAILHSSRRAVILGIIFGFIVDVTGGVPLMSSICYCICGHYASSMSRSFSGRGAINAVLVAAPLLLTRLAVSAFYLLATWHSVSFVDIMLGAVIPEYLYNLAVVLVTYPILHWLMRLFRIEALV